MLVGQRPNPAHAFSQAVYLFSRPSWRKSQRTGWNTGHGQSGRVSRKRPRTLDRRTVRTLLLLLLAISLPASIYFYSKFFRYDVKTRMLVVAGSNYPSPSPPNSFAKEDSQRLGEILNIKLHVANPEKLKNSQFLHEIEKYLENVTQSGPTEDVVLIYLSLHGVVNAAGEPCLLLPGHDPLDSKTWLPISELFDTLAAVENTKQWKKVLLLDAGRIDDCWEMGILCNTFAIALEDYLEKTPRGNLKNCFVISANSGLDVALPATEISGTPFGYYVAAGLQGAADGVSTGIKDGEVSLQELQTYVCQQVDKQVHSKHGVHQRPFCYPSTDKNLKDFALVHVPGKDKLTFPTDPWKLPLDSREIDARVEEMKQLHEEQVWQFDPLGWARAQFLLQRLDAQLLAGMAYQQDAEQTLQNLDEILQRLSRQPTYFLGTPPSLALRQLVDRNFSLIGLREELDPVWDAWKKDPQKDSAPQNYDRAVSYIWDIFVSAEDRENLPVDRQVITDRLNFCDAAAESSWNLEPVEIALLRLLERYVDWDAKDVQTFPQLSQLLQGLLRARQQSEMLAAPPDPRQHYIIAEQLAKVDQQVARAFDGVLVGTSKSLAAAQESIDGALGDRQPNYLQLTERSAGFRKALRVRDQALAAALPLARWLVRRARYYDESSTVTQFVKQTRSLGKEVDSLIQQSALSPSGAIDETKLKQRTASVEKAFSNLLKNYRDRTRDLAREGGSVREREVELPQHLRSPVAINQEYFDLHRKWLKDCSGKSAPAHHSPGNSTSAGGVGNAASADGQENIKKYLRWLQAEAVDPLVQLLGMDGYKKLDESAELAELSAALATLGGNMRERLRDGLRTDIDSLAAETEEKLQGECFASARLGLSKADRMVRGMAALLTQPRWFKPDHNLAEKLRLLDVQALVVWHGHRLLNDFWGAWERGGPRYFEAATNQLQEKLQGTDSQNSLDKRLRGCKSLFNGKWGGPLQVGHVYCGRDAFVDLPLTITPHENLPPGSLAIYLSDPADSAGKVLPTYEEKSKKSPVRRRWSCPLDDKPGPDLQLNTEELQVRSSEHLRFAVSTLFRGHWWQAPFNVQRGQVYEWEQPKPAPATVVVKGESKQISNLIIIFDCSGSMAERERFELGRTALIEILEQLKKAGNQYRVGLMFYGRRAGWENVGNNVFRIKHRDLNVFAGHPADDVEVAVPPSILNAKQLQTIIRKLNDDATQPYGETPLYLALKTALTKLRREKSAHVLVITDGVNDQSGGAGRILGGKRMINPIPKNQTTAGDVILQLRRPEKPTRIDVIEFGGKKEFKDDKERKKWAVGRAELKNITNAAGGKFHQVNANDTGAVKALIKVLRDSLQLDQYSLRPVGINAAKQPQRNDLGAPVHLGGLPSKPTEYTVHLERDGPAPITRVWVEGGEKLELVYKRENNIFEHPRWEKDLRGRDVRQRGLSVATHLPLRGPGGNNFVFRISVQSADTTKFSRRPEIVWAKIRPAGDNTARAYYFIDRHFEAGLPVPVLQFPTQDWPLGKAARLELYLAMPQDHLKSVAIQVPQPGDPLQEMVPGAALTILSERGLAGWCRIVVDEDHQSNSDHYPLHLQVVPPPDKITREFFEADRKARHVFAYKKIPPLPTIHVLTRQQISDGGVGPFIFEEVQVPK